MKRSTCQILWYRWVVHHHANISSIYHSHVALKSITTSFPSADALRRMPSTSPRVLGSRTAPPRRDMTGDDGAKGGCALKAGVSICFLHLPGIFDGDDGAADATPTSAAANRPTVLVSFMVGSVLGFRPTFLRACLSDGMMMRRQHHLTDSRLRHRPPVVGGDGQTTLCAWHIGCIGPILLIPPTIASYYVVGTAPYLSI